MMEGTVVKNKRVRKAPAPDSPDASPQYARSLIEASLDPFVTISPEGKIMDVNEATVKVTGIPRAKLVGTDFSDYFTEPERARQGYRRAFELGSVTDYPLTIKHKNGRLVDVLYNASVYRDAQGSVLGVFAAARDVTESKRILGEFAETKNFLDNILESSTKYSIISIDLNRRVLSWNEGARRNYGYTAEEIIGRDAQILHTSQDVRSGLVDRLLAEARENGLAQGEFERVRKDGTRFTASLVVTRRNDASGRSMGCLLISNDISEKKSADEQLRSVAKYARSLIEASLDPLVTISPEGKITDVNEATVKATGVPRNELIGTDFSNYFTEPANARKGYEQVFAKGYVTDYPLTMRHRDGRLASVLYNASVYKDAQGQVQGVFAAARDVTAQRQAALYARSLIEASLDPFVTISPGGKITDVNEATIKVTGAPRDELIGTDFSDYFTEPGDARGGYEQVFAKGYVTDYPLTIRHRDGRLTSVLYNASVYLDPQGEVLGVFAAARDITAQKQAEAKVAEQRAREEQQARELERLADLERFQKLTVGRELKMIELKKEIGELRQEIETLRQNDRGGRMAS
jgi:PAS domain S-box-containing protein